MTLRKTEIKGLRKTYVIWDVSLFGGRLKISSYKYDKKHNIRINIELGKIKWEE